MRDSGALADSPDQTLRKALLDHVLDRRSYQIEFEHFPTEEIVILRPYMFVDAIYVDRVPFPLHGLGGHRLDCAQALSDNILFQIIINPIIPKRISFGKSRSRNSENACDTF